MRLPRLGIGLVATAGLLALAVASMGPVSAHTTTTNAALTANSSYVSVAPYRVADTRTSTALAGGATLNVQVSGAASGVPAGAVAAVLNVTAVNPTAAGFLTVFPEGTTMPVVSNLNFAAGTIVPNLVTVGLSTSGMVSIYLNTGSTNVVVDVEGYYATQTTSGLFNPLSPSRAFGSLTIGGAIGAGVTQPVTVVGGATGVPTTASAVVLNVTAAHATLPSFLTVFPAGGTMPTASNLNFGAQAPLQAIANRVTVGVGTSGQIDVYNLTGTVNVDVDVDGYYSGAGGVGSPFVAITPIRVADTRTATLVGTETAIPAPPPQAAATETFTLATPDIPANAAGVAMNLTAVPGAAPGYLTSYPTSTATPPVASDVNWTASESPAVPNFTIADTVGTGIAQNVKVANSYFTTGATVDVIADVFGYFAPSTAAGTYTVTGGGTVPVSTCTGNTCGGIYDNTSLNSASITNAPASITAGSDNAGVVDYTASGFAAGASVNLAIFPSTGVNAPTQPYYFTPPAGPVAGVAQGEGYSNQDHGWPYAYINSVNGAAATCSNGYSYECDGITANSSGEITFSLDSFYPDGAIPVVWTTPASAGSVSALYVNADGTPQTGYEVGIGSSTTWGAPAPAATMGVYDNYAVESVSPSTNSFVACYSPNASQASVDTSSCYTFTYQSGDAYYYYETNVLLTQAQFTSYLSAANPAYTNAPAVPGDWFSEIDYNPGASYYYYNLDVPAAPTAVTATAITSGPYAGDTSINWTAPINPDVAGYTIYEAQKSTTGTYDWTTATDVTVGCLYETSSTTNCDITTPAVGTYEFEVSAYDSSYGYNGPNSAPTAPYTVVISATPAPVIDSVVIHPSASTSGLVTTAGTAVVTYNEAVNCLSAAGADFSYSDSGAGIGSVKGATCASTSADVLTITFPLNTVVSSTVTTQDVIVDPGNGDTFSYTAPTLNTTSDAVYAGTSSAPSYEANQTVTDNGNPTPTSNSGTATNPSNPLI